MDNESRPAPRHIAIIMDRNGEWAKRRTLSRMMGHREGVRTVKRIVDAAARQGVGVLSLFAFSTENWLRPQEEVSFLMKLLEEYITREARELVSEGIRLVVSGRRDRIPAAALKAIETVVEESAANTGMVLNIALDYGGRDEIAHAAALMARNVKAGALDESDIDENTFRNYLYHPELPDVDLLIRTGGEQRISNFMLWELAYAELYFTPVLWPDFSADNLKEAIGEFHRRQRRFGMTDEQIQ